MRAVLRVVLVGLIIAGTGSAHAVDLVFADSGLEAAVRDAIGKPTGTLTDVDVAGLWFLDAESRGITDLTGIEGLADLTSLNLRGNPVTSLTPLTGVPGLVFLDLIRTSVTDLTPLASINSFQSLVIGGSLADPRPVPDLSPLTSIASFNSLYVQSATSLNVTPISQLTSLTFLAISDCGLTNVDLLAPLTSLTVLNLEANAIVDVSVVANFTQLESLLLAENQIANVSPIQNLTALQTLTLTNNPITNHNALSGLVNLLGLRLGGTAMASTAPLANMTAIDFLDISHNNLTELNGLANMSALRELHAESNLIADISGVTDFPLIDQMDLSGNLIADISPLALLSGWDALDTLDLSSNPLGDKALCYDVPSLESRGVVVTYDGECGTPPFPCPMRPVLLSQGEESFPLIGLNWQNADGNNDGIPDRVQAMLVGHVLCLPQHPLHEATVDAFVANVILLQTEPAPSPLALSFLVEYKELVAALLLTSVDGRDYLKTALNLVRDYAVVSFPSKAFNEPYSGQGDLDGDGATNATEYNSVVALGGNDADFVFAATQPQFTGAEELPLAPWAVAVLAAVLLTAAAVRLRALGTRAQ